MCWISRYPVSIKSIKGWEARQVNILQWVMYYNIWKLKLCDGLYTVNYWTCAKGYVLWDIKAVGQAMYMDYVIQKLKLCDGFCTLRNGNWCLVMIIYCDICKLKLCDGLYYMRYGSSNCDQLCNVKYEAKTVWWSMYWEIEGWRVILSKKMEVEADT